MYNFRSVCLISSMLALLGCAGGMIPGNIIAENGKVLEFQIERARRTGEVRAFDPSSGERFSGRYVGILETVSSSGTAFVHSGTRSATAFGSSSTGSNIGNATAFLTGDRGTSLNCEMKIEAGLSPHGMGACSDQRGGRYRLQF